VDAGGAGVVRILDEFPQRDGALQVVGQHLRTLTERATRS
jgi:hypothetical protein